MKKYIFNSIKFIVSISLLGYLIYLADFSKIIQQISSVNLGYFLLAILSFLVALFFLTWRWKLLLNHYHIKPGFQNLYIFYLIGFFFNNFLPTTVGGDVSRAYNVARISGNKADSIGIIILERVIGVLATLSFAAMSMFWVIRYFNTSRIIYLILGLSFTFLILLLSILSRRSLKLIVLIFSYVRFFDLGKKFSDVLKSIHQYRHAKLIMFQAYILSLISQFVLITMNYILALSLNLPAVTLGYLFLVVPVTFIIGLLPSINGLGVRDSGYVFLLTRIGLTPAEAISLSFLNTIVPLLVSMVGGVFFTFYKHPSPVKELQEINTEIDL